MHCDLKPENVLIKSYSRCEIKVIDLGSSCFITDNLCLYVQSRSYRAPEVILGHPYDQKIDIWSLGCILAELYTGEVSLYQNLFIGYRTFLQKYPFKLDSQRIYNLIIIFWIILRFKLMEPFHALITCQFLNLCGWFSCFFDITGVVYKWFRFYDAGPHHWYYWTNRYGNACAGTWDQQVLHRWLWPFP